MIAETIIKLWRAGASATRSFRAFASVAVFATTGLMSVHGQTERIHYGWKASWGCSQLEPYGTEVLPTGALEGSTLRQIVHLSTGGPQLRLRFCNAFGQEALELASVHVALRAAGREAGEIDASTDRKILFAGKEEVSVPKGAEYISDPIAMPVAEQSDLVVTTFVSHAPSVPTFHAGAHATSFLVKGKHLSEARLDKPQAFTRWYFLTEIETAAPAGPNATVIAFGDSITDGHGSTTDGNDRWPDVLARRVSADIHTRGMGVVNEGIGGNHLLTDGLGPNALARFDRDVLSIAGAHTLIVMEGINDLGGLDRTEAHSQATHDALVVQVEAALSQIAVRAHEHGLKVIGATLTPYVGSDYYHPNEMSEADRISVNNWIRHSDNFDGVVDFDEALRDPVHLDRMLPEYDSGDHLHPGPAGYKRMGDVIPLKILR